MSYKKVSFIVLFILMEVMLLALGIWQVQRLAWKRNLIQTIEKRLTLPAVSLNGKRELAQPNLEYRKVTASGKFMHKQEIYLYAGKQPASNKSGYFILAPLQLADKSFVLVNRGFVPDNQKLPAARPETLIDGTVEIHGILLKPETKPRFMPANNLEQNIWFWIDIGAARQYTKLELPNIYIMEQGTGETALPIKYNKSILQNIRNEHLNYAITWFSIALATSVLFVLYIRKN